MRRREGAGLPVLTPNPQTQPQESFPSRKERSEHGSALVALVRLCDRSGGTAARLRGSLSLCPEKEGGEDAVSSNTGFSQQVGLERVCFVLPDPFSPPILYLWRLQFRRFWNCGVRERRNCNTLSSGTVESESGVG